MAHKVERGVYDRKERAGTLGPALVVVLWVP